MDNKYQIAKTIIKDGDCFNIECEKCPFYHIPCGEGPYDYRVTLSKAYIKEKDKVHYIPYVIDPITKSRRLPDDWTVELDEDINISGLDINDEIIT